VQTRRSLPLAAAATAFAGALGADLLTKAFMVANAASLDVFLMYNRREPELGRRLVMCAVAVAAVAVLARLAHWRGIGTIWGAWIGVGVLVGGVVGNGVSPRLWPAGVPDFIPMPGGWVWNLADFEIGAGLLGGLGSIAVWALLAFARERLDQAAGSSIVNSEPAPSVDSTRTRPPIRSTSSRTM
jgi:hypothetical protein